MKINRSRVLVVSALALASAQAFADGPSFYALVDGGIASSSITGAGTTRFQVRVRDGRCGAYICRFEV